ncbi:UvrD-helicase domain-containing protein [Nostoc punctiforme UO1]|uniref:UvrD-helicase domain-containing protein n=1 Tax=Nostoc punctiforme TaxID=272131 RepID=UPI0030ABB0A2
MDNNLQIDNVQSFVKAIGDNDKFWRLLHKKEISRLKEEVKYKDQKRNIAGVKYYTQGKVYAVHELETSEMSIEIEYRDGLIFRYKKEQFIRKFSNISPPISRQEIFELVRSEQEAKDAQKRKAEKQVLLEKVKNQFEQDFLNVDNFYQAQCTEYISFQEYQAEKLNYVQSWVQNNLNSSPDLEQAAAISAVEGHIQVVARAGSGKTSTLVNRALFLQKHCGVAPNEILLLAFNRKAAEEIRERLTLQLQSSIPHVMTFHALAYALVHPEKSILFNERDGQQNKAQVLQTVIYEYHRKPDVYEKFRVLMMAHFREDWERIAWGGYDKSPE